MHAQVVMRTVNTLVHGSLVLPPQGLDRRVVEHFDAFALGYNHALKGHAPI